MSAALRGAAALAALGVLGWAWSVWGAVGVALIAAGAQPC